uniref:Aluminum-activated malate transporter 10-like n=1 Tax=Tanacetum cinerariifolium TaxID=118510 RepID=A0A6L2JBR0_TANCI|nr:aluminum-activated malate transporter 10-like [Tanacetum cinerariifolium]
MQRLSTIILGTALCIITSMLVCPVWAGMELHLLILCNMDNLANSLDSCVAEYFSNGDVDSKKKLHDYKCVLNSKASEESMADFARWEPAHGHFNFRHPWNNYVKIGSSSRSCAYCIETLISCMDTRNQVPETIRKHFSSSCLRLCSCSSNVIRELSTTVSSMTHAAQIDLTTNEMKKAVEDLQNDLKSLPGLLIQSHKEQHKKLELLEVIPLVTFVSLLIELASRIEGGILKTVEELADLAKFKKIKDEMELQKTQDTSKIVDNMEKVIAHQRV